MKPVLIGILPILAAACSSVEIPTVEIGSGGLRVRDGKAKNPTDAYLEAYSDLGRQHYNVRRNLEGRGQNLYGAHGAMERILQILETLQSLVVPEQKPLFEPYLARYRQWLQEVDRNTWGGSFLQDLDRSERELRQKFHPDRMEIAVAPAAATAEPTPPGGETGSGTPRRDPAPPGPGGSRLVEPPPSPPPSAPPGGVSPRLLYKAWERAHEDLVQAYRSRKETKRPYEDVLEALRHLKAAYPGKPAEILEYWIGWYGRIHQNTRGFTILPENTTEQEVMEELNVAARVLRQEFNPDRPR